PRELRARHSVDNQWDLLEPLGIPRPSPDTHPTELVADRTAVDAVHGCLNEAGIGSGQRLVLVHVGARIHFRRWPADHFIDAIAHIADADDRTRFVVIAGPDEDTAWTVVTGARRRLPAGRDTHVLDPRHWTLDELQAL